MEQLNLRPPLRIVKAILLILALIVLVRFSAQETLAGTTGTDNPAGLPPGQQGSQRDVTFANGAVSLSGTVYLPAGEGPFPGIIILHGAGPETRAPYREDAETFAAHGIAALVFDKRGTGQSSGNWRTATLYDLIDDGLAGLQALQQQPDVSPTQVGLVGISQGAWLLPFAAAQSDDVAFIVPVTGAAIPLAAQEMWGVGNDLAGRGFSERAIDTTMKGMHLLFSARPFIQKGLLPLDDLWFNTYDPFLDPATAWADVAQPALVIFAGQDRLVPTTDSVGLVEKVLADGGHPASQTVVFPNASHALGGTVNRNAHAEYVALVTGWIQAVTAGTAPPAGSPTHPPNAALRWYGIGGQATPWYGTSPVQVTLLLLFILNVFLGSALAGGRLREGEWRQALLLGGMALLSLLLLAGWGAALGYLLNADANEATSAAVPFSLFSFTGALLYLVAAGIGVAVLVRRRSRGDAISLPRIVFNTLSLLFLFFLGYWGLLGLPL